METLWPWLSIVGLGVLHGLSPANGWMFAAACGLRAGDAAQIRPALLCIAIGHAASVAIVVFSVAQGVLMDRLLVQKLAGALLIGAAAYRALRGNVQRARRHHDASLHDAHAGHAGIALWSCLMATAHGTGLMLVPALLPLCMSDNPARAITASGSLLLAMAAVSVHLAAMLLTTGAIASGVCRSVRLLARLPGSAALRQAWTAALVATGGLLMTLR